MKKKLGLISQSLKLSNIIIVAPFVLALAVSGNLLAQDQSYEALLQQIRTSDHVSDIENLYEKGRETIKGSIKAAAELSEKPLAVPGFSVVESGNKWDWKTDFQFFLDLAVAKGVPADRDFFQNVLRTTHPGEVYPRFIKSLPAKNTNCVDYGHKLLVTHYEIWSEYKKKYPNKYKGHVEKALQIPEQMFGQPNVCGDSESLRTEITAFLAVPISAEFRAKLTRLEQDLKGDSSAFHFKMESP